MKHAIALIALLCSSTIAGPLVPPAGPIASTMKTIEQAEPRTPINATNMPGDADSVYKITVPGSYYLTGNLNAVAGKSGIEIAADNVTIDLMGFTLDGVVHTGGGTSLDGIRVQPGVAVKNTLIRNGIVDSWGHDGIDLTITAQSAGGAAVLENVRATNNAHDGISAPIGSLIRGCIASHNAFTGIEVESNGVIDACTADHNGGSGFVLTSAGVITNSTGNYNSARGLYLQFGSRASGCNFSFNEFTGVAITDGCTILDCTVSFNFQGDGITVAGSKNRIEGNDCHYNKFGIRVTAPDNIIVRNTCSSNTTNWSIVADNFYGPIVDRTAAATPAVNSNFAIGTLGSSDPNANITY